MENDKVINLGNYYNPNHTGGSYGGIVYDKEGIAPCLDCATGGGRTPMIIVERNE